MVDAVAEAVAFNFGVDGKGAMVSIIMKRHLRGVVAGFAVDKVADGGVFDDHFRPEGIAGEAEKI